MTVAPIKRAEIIYKGAQILKSRTDEITRIACMEEGQPFEEGKTYVAELSSDLGVEAVGKLCLGDAWTAEDRSVFVRLGDTRRTQRKTTRRPRGDTKRQR